MSRDSQEAPDESLSAWMTESKQQLQEDKQKLNARLNQPLRGPDDCFATLPLGGHDKLRSRLKAEMNKEYNEFLSKQKTGRRREAAGLSVAPAGDSAERPSRLPVPINNLRDQFVDRRGEGTELERHSRDLERREPMGPPPLAPRYDPLEELRLRRYFENQLYSGARQGYYGYPPSPQDTYRYNPYVDYYQQMGQVWGPDRDLRQSPPPQREKRVSFTQEWPEESELYGWARHGRCSEMRMREEPREERRCGESPLNRSRSAPPEKKERSPGGFMDGFGSGNRGRDEERRRREEYAKELRDQIRSKQLKHSSAMEGKRALSSRPPTPPSLSQQHESPPKQRILDPLDYYKSPGQPDHLPQPDNSINISSAGTELSRARNESSEQESYRRVLEQQIEESRRRKTQRERELARSREEPVGEWNPWGRGGGGAPLKDSSGRVVADLKVLNKANQARDKTGTSPKLEALADICALNYNLSPGQKTVDPALSPGAGSPSPSKKEPALTPQQEYREFLRQQVEEKKARRLAEDARQREEDRREAERLEAERLKIQEDYQRELAKQREKEEAVRRKNEEQKLAAQERKKAPFPEKVHRRERRISSPVSSPLRTLEPRNSSPPIPTLRNRQTPGPTPDPRETLPLDVRERSPPVPSLRSSHALSPPDSPLHAPIRTSETVELIRTDLLLSPLPAHSDSSLSAPQCEAVRQLTDMKHQLRHENDRVKQQLELSQDACREADMAMRHAVPNASQQPMPKIFKAAKPPFKIKKSTVPPKPPVEGASGGERRTVGFHLQNTQPKSKAYHREYAPLLKGRCSPPGQSRPDSTGSNVSISSLDIEALTLKNDNRMKRLESLLRSNQDLEERKPSPESVINQLLQRGPVRRNKQPSNHAALDEFSL